MFMMKCALAFILYQFYKMLLLYFIFDLTFLCSIPVSKFDKQTSFIEVSFKPGSNQTTFFKQSNIIQNLPSMSPTPKVKPNFKPNGP